MTYYMSDSNQRLGKAMSQEQLSQIIEAILAGKYSWACVLMLRFIGYNPLHYIPYRTYNRLVKENCQLDNSSEHKVDSVNTERRDASHQLVGQVSAKTGKVSSQTVTKISDLSYLETAHKPQSQIRGGNDLNFW